MRRHGGMPFWTRTDADGRYRVSGHQTDGTYFTTVYPSASSGYLDAKDIHQGWPAGAKFLEVNFALEKGRLVSGRVIDRDTKQPIAGAAVVYQPAPENSNNTDRHDFRNTVLTDPEGKFVITALRGEGYACRGDARRELYSHADERHDLRHDCLSSRSCVDRRSQGR